MTARSLFALSALVALCLGLVRDSAASSPDTVDGTAAPAQVVAASTALAELDAWQRANAVLDVELCGNPTPDAEASAAAAERLWNSGDFEAALLVIRALEETEVEVATGIAWKTPVPSSSPDNLADVRIGAPRDDAVSVSLDYDAETGNLFSVIQWASGTWTMNISTDDGRTWSETYEWYTSGWADLAVADQYAYVGYLPVSASYEARLRRFHVADGSVDAVYDYLVVFNFGPGLIEEIVLGSNADFLDNRIYYGMLTNGGTLLHFWAVADTALNFIQDSPSLTNAASGLDGHWNQHFLNNESWYFYSYLGTDNAVHVDRWIGTNTWDEVLLWPGYSGLNQETKISAYRDTVLVAAETTSTNGNAIYYRISYNAGLDWSTGTFAEPDPGEGSYWDFDVTARGGLGTAAVCTQETGEPDDVLFTYRLNYQPGPWSEHEIFSDHDVATGGTDLEINWLGSGYGMIYIDGADIPRFDRPDFLFADGFESGDTASWSSTFD